MNDNLMIIILIDCRQMTGVDHFLLSLQIISCQQGVSDVRSPVKFKYSLLDGIPSIPHTSIKCAPKNQNN